MADFEVIHNNAMFELKTILDKYDRRSDPTVWDCQHKIAEMNNYTYCPECGEKFAIIELESRGK